MSDILTMPEAEALASRTSETIKSRFGVWPGANPRDPVAYALARVESDLAGLREHQGEAIYYGDEDAGVECAACRKSVEGAPCPDARRYSDGLRATADLYGQ